MVIIGDALIKNIIERHPKQLCRERSHVIIYIANDSQEGRSDRNESKARGEISTRPSPGRVRERSRAPLVVKVTVKRGT